MQKYITLFMVCLLAFFTSAQEKDKSGLKDIKGKVQKITITTDEGTVTIEGREAEKLFKKMKRQPPMIFRMDSGDIEGEHNDSMNVVIKIDEDDTLNAGKSIIIRTPHGGGMMHGMPDMKMHMGKMKKHMEEMMKECMKADSTCAEKGMKKECCGMMMHGGGGFNMRMSDDEEEDDDMPACEKGTTVIIEKTENGKTTIEKYTGDEAVIKMKDIEKEEGKPGKGTGIKKKVIIKSDKPESKTDREDKKERNE